MRRVWRLEGSLKILSSWRWIFGFSSLTVEVAGLWEDWGGSPNGCGFALFRGFCFGNGEPFVGEHVGIIDDWPQVCLCWRGEADEEKCYCDEGVIASAL
jgi:hypothetical protein